MIESGHGGSWRLHNAPLPKRGYALVKVEYGLPPGEAQSVVGHFERREQVSVPDSSKHVGYVVYDSTGTLYTASDFD